MDEEVWKDLTLSSLLRLPTTTSASRPPLSGWLIQDTDLDLRIISPPERIILQSNFSPLTSSSTITSLCPCTSRKRGTTPTINENVIDRKRKRLIKNRESAARSRARRQAYTYELESEIAHLVEENTKLRIQVEKLSVAAPGLDEHPKRKKLQRTLSNPF